MNLGNESEYVEFKESTGEKHEALEAMAAIINKHGHGTLYFGVKDNGYAKGQIVKDSTIKDLTESISADIEPRIIPTIEAIEHESLTILKVTFFGTQVPYSAFGKFLIRVGTQNRKMSRDELVKLVKKSDYSLDWEKKAKWGIDDIDDDTLRNFYSESVNCGRLDAMTPYDEKELLSGLGLLENDFLTNAGYYLFSNRKPVVLKIAIYVTDERINFSDIRRVEDNIYNLIRYANSYIKEKMNWKVEQGNGVARIEKPEIPVEVIREIVVNSICSCEL